MRGELALTGGAALAAGLLLGFVVDRVARMGAAAVRACPEPAPRRAAEPRVTPKPRAAAESPAVTEVLERFRLAAAL
jgi:hypothetical protein